MIKTRITDFKIIRSKSLRLNEEIESQSKSIATLMEETKAKNDELQHVNEQVTKFEALHEELKKEIILLTGEAGPDKIREEFQSELCFVQCKIFLNLLKKSSSRN